MKKIVNYKQAIQFLYENLPMFQRQGAPAMKKDLTNIRLLLEALAHPQNKFSSIHIAGTNGKGSTSHILSALFQAHNKNVALYTSPHYRDFRERMKINNQLVPKDFVVTFINENLELIERVRPSFFEITVAMAFQYFSEQQVDIAIIEVGLGGRLDSTNILDPEITAITNISYDHQQFLGDTLEEIAGEKAGIIKDEIPVIIGEKQEEINHIFESIARQKNAPINYAEELVSVTFDEKNLLVNCHVDSYEFSFKAQWFTDYQIKNLKTAIAVFMAYAKRVGMIIEWDSVSEYLEDLPYKTYFLGRWMTLGESPKIIAESAHNMAGLLLAFEKLKNLSYAQLHMVLGFSDDKNLSTIMDMFPKTAKYYFAKADIPRGMDAQKLKEAFAKNKLKGRSYVSVKNALQAAKRAAKKDDFIYVGGSIFVVAEVV